MPRIKTLSRPVAIGFTLAVLLLALTLHHWPWPAQAAQRLASALMLRPVAKATLPAQPNAAPLVAPLVAMATLTVNSLEDTATAGDGKCTLREALNNANAAGQTTGGDCVTGTGTDTISFSVSGTINLTGALPEINSNVTMSGPGPNQLEVHRGTGGDYRIFTIPLTDKTVNISGLKITNGNLPNGMGGGILNVGHLTLTNCVISGNTVGANNSAGGGVHNNAGTLTMVNSTISGNSAFQGGGVFNASGSLTITGSTISGNSAFSGLPGGVGNVGATAVLTNCTISANTGTGLSNISGGSSASLTVTNCTITGNSSTGFASGIFTFGATAGFTSTTMLKNTLVANNTGINFQTVKNTGANAALTSLGNNLDSDGTSGFTNGVNGNIVGTAANKIDAKLGPLADNGGLTQTHALMSTSPAIDKGSAATGVTTDQRGMPRPVDLLLLPNAAGGDGSDIGAFEVQANFTVNDLGDTPDASVGNGICADSNGKCTLRAAIQEMNVLGTGQITLNVTGTINLTSALPNINSTVGILGPGVNQLEVRRNTGGDYRIFNVLAGKSLSISGLKITNGKSPSGEGGGGIQSAGTLTLTNCEVSGNTATALGGGGVYSFGPSLTISNSTISGNTITSGTGGGLRIFSPSQGDTVTVNITGSTVSGNTAIGVAAGGLAMSDVAATLTNCTISGNTGAVGGLGVSASVSTLVMLINCTVANNTATMIGGIALGADPGIQLQTRLRNTLVAGNLPRNFNAPDVNGAQLILLSNNLDSDGTSEVINGFNGNLVGTANNKIDAKLGPLADNGGPTRTHLLLCTSPAIDKGTITDAPATDQRGVARPVGTAIDIGAVEAVFALTINPDQLPGGVATKPFNQMLTATGGTAPYTFAATTALPTGLTLSAAGVLSGTPPAVGSFNFSVQVTDATGAQGCRLYTLFVNPCQTLTINPTTLPVLTVGTEFGQAFSVTSTNTGLTWTLTGALPAGLSFSELDGVRALLVGTPTQQGNFPITVRATDTFGCFSERSYTLTINCPALALNPPLLTAGAVNVAYNQTLIANCGTAPINFTVSAGALPSGLSLSAGGVLSGTPTTAGLSIFSIKAMDANGQMTTRSYTLPIYQKHMVTASDGAVGDQFGTSVAISGDTAIVGAVAHDSPNFNQGAAYIYVRNGAAWTQQAKLTAIDGAAFDNFGFSVAISGDTAIVGANVDDVGANFDQGSAYIFVRNGTSWTQQAKLTAIDGAASDNFGFSVAISGETALVGANFHDVGANVDQGSAYVFVRSGTTWTQQARLAANDAGTLDRFGWSVALSGNTALVGAPTSSPGQNFFQGSAYIFVRSGTTWTQQAKLTANDGTAIDVFGWSVALSGETALVGANLDDVGASVDQGSAYVFVRSGTAWTQQAKLTASDGVTNDRFGTSVAISGNRAVIGAPQDNAGLGSFQGSAYVFMRSGTSWTQQAKLTASDGADNEFFGQAVALSGNTALVGSPFDDIGANGNQGSAHFFDLSFCPNLPITPASLPIGTPGVAYQQTLTASGGAPPYNFIVSSGTLPTGLTLSTSGVISGTPTVVATSNFSITVTDANGCTGTQLYSIVVNVPCPTITVAPATIPAATVGTGYSQTFAFSRTGGTGAITFSLIGTLPAGMSFVSSSVAGTPTEAGSFPITVRATDVNGCFGERSYTLTVTCPAALTINPPVLPAAELGSEYHQTLMANCGVAPINFTVVAGLLPVGITLSPDGILSGVPNRISLANFTIKATDAMGQTATRTYKLPIADIETEIAHDFGGGADFGISVAISGDTAIVGAPLATIGSNQAQGAAYIFVRENGAWSQQARIIADDGAANDQFGTSVAISGNSVIVGAQGATIGAKAGQGAAYVFVRNGTTWTQQSKLTANDGAAGDQFGNAVALNGETALIGAVGANAAQGAAYAFVRNGTNWAQQAKLTSNDGAAGDNFGGSVALSGETALVGAALKTVGANTLQGAAYIFVRNATNWTQQAKLTANDGAAGDQFGASVALNGDTALVGATGDDIGANINQGSAYVFVRSGTSWTQQAQLTASDGVAGDFFGNSVALSGEMALVGAQSDDLGAIINQGSAYVFVRSGTSWVQQAQLTALDGATSDAFGFSVSLSGNTALVGVPGDDLFANDERGSARFFELAVNICPALTINPSSLPGGSLNISYNQTLTATGGVPNYDFIVTDGALPSGLELFFGVLSGTPTAAGTFNFTVTVVDVNGCVGTRDYTLIISPCAPLGINPVNLTNGTVGANYSRQLSGVGGTAPYSFTITAGALPPGFTLSTSGLISGKTTASGTFTFTVKVTDANGCTGTQNYTLVITPCPTITISPTTIGDGTVGARYKQRFTRTGGRTPITFSLIGALPAGLNFHQLSNNQALLVGIPAQAGSFPITVRATDANGCFGERSYTLTVTCPAALTITPPVVPAGAVGAAYTQTLLASCGTAPFNFTVSAGALPNGLMLSTAGVLSGTPTSTGLSIFTVTAMDAMGQTATRSYTLNVYQQQSVTASDGAANDQFGQAVALSGDTAIVGVYQGDVNGKQDQGSAYIYVRNGATWTQQAKLVANDGLDFENFGISVAIDGNTAIVGAYFASFGDSFFQGAAYVFVRNGTTWTQQAKLTASDAGEQDLFGVSVAISGETALVGSWFDTVGGNAQQGSAYVFVRSGTTWTQQAKLTASDGAASDFFGVAVALSGNTAVIGAYVDDVGANADQGSAYVFVRSGTTWTQQAKLTASDGAASDGFGISVAIEGDTVLIGATSDDVGVNVNQGSAYIFVRQGTTWTQQAQLMASNGIAYDLFGSSVALSGETAIIGKIWDDVNGNPNSGGAYVFTRSGTNWTQQAQLTASDGAGFDEFGAAAAISGNTVLVGAYLHNVGANADQGSAYFFNLSLGACSTLTINPASLPGGTLGAAYNQTLTATGGTPAYTFTSGALPPGLTLSTSGLLSGTPTANGTFNFNITATDANGCVGTQAYTLIISVAPACVPVALSTTLSGATGSVLTVPIIVGDLTGRGVTAYDFTLTFDPAVIKPSSTAVDSAGTLSSGFTVTSNTSTPGRITVSAFGAGALTGAGTLLNLKFDLIGAAPACSNLTWFNFVFNEGTPCATTSNGQACITGGSISGAVNYATAPTTRPVPNVLITAAGTPSATATTSSTGSYSLTGLGGGSYTVTPSKTGQVNGISSFDASLAAQHAAGLIQLTAMQQIAADASNNGSVSSFDASLIAQTAAGISNSGIAGTWKFVPANRSYSNLSGNQTNQNFDAVLVGDVSGNWTPPASGAVPDAPTATQSIQFIKPVAEAANPIIVSLPQVTGAPGAAVTIPITVSDLTGLGVVAYDFTLVFDPSVLQLQSPVIDAAGTLSSGLTITPNASTPGRLVISAFGSNALRGAGTLLNLKFNVVGAGGAATTLAWQACVVNEDTSSATATNGNFAVQSRSR